MIIGKRDKHEIVTKQILYYAVVIFARSSTFHKHTHAWSTANKMESPLIVCYGRNVDTRNGVVRTAQHVAPGHLIRRTPLQHMWVLWLYNLPPHTGRNSNKRRSELFRFDRFSYIIYSAKMHM